MPLKSALFRLLFVPLALLLAAHTAQAQGSAFTYQGRLTDGGSPPTGTYEAANSRAGKGTARAPGKW
jgi:hypothetical protein